MRRDGRHQRSRLCVAKVRTRCVEGGGRALQSTASSAAGFSAGRKRGAASRGHKEWVQTDRLFFAARSLRPTRSNPAGGTRRLSCRTRQALWIGRVTFEAKLLDLGFLEFDVLPRNRLVFLERQLFRLGAGVFLGHIEIARVRRGQKLDLDHCGLRHSIVPLCGARRAVRTKLGRVEQAADHTDRAPLVNKRTAFLRNWTLNFGASCQGLAAEPRVL